MNNDHFLTLIKQTTDHIYELSSTKGREYTDGSADRLENFKSEGKNIGITEYQIWSVYASKHFRAIQSFIRNDGKIFSNESIDGRIDDLILYLLLLKGLIADRESKNADSAAGTLQPAAMINGVPVPLYTYNVIHKRAVAQVRLTADEYARYQTTKELPGESLARNHLD